MKIRLNKDGVLVITPETDQEEGALFLWYIAEDKAIKENSIGIKIESCGD